MSVLSEEGKEENRLQHKLHSSSVKFYRSLYHNLIFLKIYMHGLFDANEHVFYLKRSHSRPTHTHTPREKCHVCHCAMQKFSFFWLRYHIRLVSTSSEEFVTIQIFNIAFRIFSETTVLDLPKSNELLDLRVE